MSGLLGCSSSRDPGLLSCYTGNNSAFSLLSYCTVYFSEVLRVLDSLQLTMYQKGATPANWQSGGECMVLPSVRKDEAAKLFPQHRIAPVGTISDSLL